MVPAAAPRCGGGAGLAPRSSPSASCNGVVPCRFLKLGARAACAAVVLRVLTQSLTRPVSRTDRLLTGDSTGAPGLICVDPYTSPFRVRKHHARAAHVCVCGWFLPCLCVVAFARPVGALAGSGGLAFCVCLVAFQRT